MKKYIAEQFEMSTGFDRTQIIFADLDHDSVSERIHTFFNLSGNVAVALTEGNATVGQWNFKGIYQPDCARIMTGDYNSNGFDEIYIFTLVEDSVFLHVMEYSLKPAFILNDRFIATIGKNLKNPDHRIIPAEVTDMTGDGYGDLVFGISSGFSKQPRSVFIFDLVKDSLIKSPESGAFIGKILLYDLDGDKFKEVVLSTYAASNYNDIPFPFTDTSCWLMVLDHDLKFGFAPVEFPGAPGTLDITIIQTKENGPIILGKYGIISPVKKTAKLFLVTFKGYFVKEKELKPDEPASRMGFMPLTGNKIFHIAKTYVENDGFYEIDEDLHIRKKDNIKFSRMIPVILDIDQDGPEEIIVLESSHKQHLILRSDYSFPVPIDLPIQASNPVFSVKLNGDEPSQLSVQGDQDWKLFDYGINPVYKYRFLIYPGIYLVILGFIILIRKLYSFQLKKKYETEKEMARLQLSSVKAQMEPHFIMNTINTIGSSIYRQKSDEAYKLLLNFSGMVRSLLISSDKLTRTLNEETGFVKNYLELEKSRFGELFTYSINQSEDVNPEVIIPKMIIQIHAENALKHGLIPKKTGGVLEIVLVTEGEYLVITVKDNGIGRNAALNRNTSSTGRGMKILNQLFETYNKYNRKPLKQEITDLYDKEGKSAGTLVKIFVPLDFNEEIY